MPYPQKPPMSEDALDAFYREHHIALLCSRNPDSSIHAVPVTYAYDDGEFLMGTQGESRKAQNVVRNGSVTLTIDDRVPPYKAVMIYGTARVDRSSVEDTRTRILTRGMSEDQAREFVRLMGEVFDSLVIRVRPNHVVSVDYSQEGFLPD